MGKAIRKFANSGDFDGSHGAASFRGDHDVADRPGTHGSAICRKAHDDFHRAGRIQERDRHCASGTTRM